MISVLLSVYNGEATLRHSLESIAKQTYRVIEVICINDASTDRSLQILKQWQEQNAQLRITIITNEENLGLTKSLKKALAMAQGEFIARLDADDWWVPEKLEKQLAYLSKHPMCGVVGCWYVNVRSSGNTLVRLPATPKEIRKKIFWRNPFGHSCVLIRKHVLDTVGAYDASLRYGQDRDLWFRLLPITEMANIPETLCYRTVDEAISTTSRHAQILQQCKTVYTYAQKYHASPLVYFSLIEPLCILIIPNRLRQAVRAFYDYFFAH